MPKFPKFPKPGEVVPFPSPAIEPLEASRMKFVHELSPAELDLFDAAHAAVELLDGKPERLANRLAAGAELRPVERAALVRWLRGEVTRPKHRPKDRELLPRMLDATRMFRGMRAAGEKEEVARRAVAERFGVSKSTVRDWVRECRDWIMTDKY